MEHSLGCTTSSNECVSHQLIDGGSCYYYIAAGLSHALLDVDESLCYMGLDPSLLRLYHHIQ